jgi:negative regulator of replication initiation
MNGGGVFRYAATPVRKIGEGASNVLESLLANTGKVAHNVVYGASKAVGRAANALNNTGKSLMRNPLKARTRRHSRRA